MKMCVWFLIFVLVIFEEVMALADSYLVPATPATFFIRLTETLLNVISRSKETHVISQNLVEI